MIRIEISYTSSHSNQIIVVVIIIVIVVVVIIVVGVYRVDSTDGTNNKVCRNSNESQEI